MVDAEVLNQPKADLPFFQSYPTLPICIKSYNKRAYRRFDRISCAANFTQNVSIDLVSPLYLVCWKAFSIFNKNP